MKIFHHDDTDGRCSAAVLLKSLAGMPVNVVEVSYERGLPLESIRKNESIYIVDFSMQPAASWKKLLAVTKNVVWIDHHASAIDAAKGTPAEDLEGIRDVNDSAALLTWKYCFRKSPPEAVKLVSDFDTWKHAFGEKSLCFVAGLTGRDEPENPLWKDLLADDTRVVLEVIEQGRWIRRALLSKAAEVVEKFGFEAKFAGHKCFVVNSEGLNSEAFGEKINRYDIVATFVWTGKEYTVSLYTVRPDLDVGKIAKLYGGGGHKGAAGFQCKQNPFKK